MKPTHIIILLIVIATTSSVLGQSSYKPSKWAFTGYVKDLQLAGYDKFDDDWFLSNEIHNRFDLRWYPSDHISAHAGMRNRFIHGNMISAIQKETPELMSYFDYDPGYFDLTKVWAEGESYVFLSSFDRLNFEFTKGKFEAAVGRQRVNWGINMVWTPNDIFNSFSY